MPCTTYPGNQNHSVKEFPHTPTAVSRRVTSTSLTNSRDKMRERVGCHFTLQYSVFCIGTSTGTRAYVYIVTGPGRARSPLTVQQRQRTDGAGVRTPDSVSSLLCAGREEREPQLSDLRRSAWLSCSLRLYRCIGESVWINISTAGLCARTNLPRCSCCVQVESESLSCPTSSRRSAWLSCSLRLHRCIGESVWTISTAGWCSALLRAGLCARTNPRRCCCSAHN